MRYFRGLFRLVERSRMRDWSRLMRLVGMVHEWAEARIRLGHIRDRTTSDAQGTNIISISHALSQSNPVLFW